MSTIIHRWLLFFFNDTATTEIYTLSLHDALPISVPDRIAHQRGQRGGGEDERQAQPTVSGQGAAGQKERHGRERQPDLLGEHPTEDDQVAVPDENVDDSVHYAPAGYQVDPIPRSPTIAAPRGAQEKIRLDSFRYEGWPRSVSPSQMTAQRRALARRRRHGRVRIEKSWIAARSSILEA